MSTQNPENAATEARGSPTEPVRGEGVRALTALAGAALAGAALAEGALAEAPLSEGRRRWLSVAYVESLTRVVGMVKRSGVDAETARDIAHDVFVTLSERIRHDGIPANRDATLASIAKFKVSNHARRRRRSPPIADGACPDDAPGSRPDGARRAHMGECERMVEAVLVLMRPEAAQLIRLVDLEKRSIVEAAAIVGHRIEAVKKQHERALHRFEALTLRLFGDAAGRGG